MTIPSQLTKNNINIRPTCFLLAINIIDPEYTVAITITYFTLICNPNGIVSFI